MKAYTLISVSDKSGVAELAVGLNQLGYGILSTSNTARAIREQVPEITEISELTGFPEILDGRVKTLHPKVHAGILADRNLPDHLQTLRQHQIDRIDIVVVNLYPFATVCADEDATHAKIIENIDIGGPTLVRAAAKNYAYVIVLTDPADYLPTLKMLQSAEGVPLKWRQHLAAKAFRMISIYDRCIEDYFDSLHSDSQSQAESSLSIRLPLLSHLRYGENPHQAAAFYACGELPWKVLHGKEMSFNNILDLDSSLRGIRLFETPTAMITKHNNPCGAGSADNLCEAYYKAFATDTDSPFGGIVIVNRELDLQTALIINQTFMEIIIAPGFCPEAWELLIKKKNRRLVQYDAKGILTRSIHQDIRVTPWGCLAQNPDPIDDDPACWHTVTIRKPTPLQMQELAWAWKVVAMLKSNAIAITSNNQALGLGIGQTSRVESTRIALSNAKRFQHELSDAVCASDGFFPYPDSVALLYESGIKSVIQPGGSKGDEDVIKACDELGMAMVFTGVRHFRH